MTTIVALASAPGLAGVSVIRLSGPDSFKLAGQLHAKGQAAVDAPRQMFYGDAAGIDDAMIVAFVAPHSYTGEDVVELYAHGNPLIVQQLVDQAIGLGARPAEPGEFTKRAYLNGRLDLVQAEAVGDLIEATSQQALQLARNQMGGEWSQKVQAIEKQLLSIMAQASAWLDFGEEDISDYQPEQVAADIKAVIQRIDAWLNGAAAATIIRDGFKVALTGLPNAGKSSLLNALAGFERAIVTDIAGTTRDTIEYQLHINGYLIELIDTAGLRDSNDAVEALGIERARAAALSAHAVLVLASGEQDFNSLAAHIPKSKSVIGVQTKTDISDKPLNWRSVNIDQTITTSSKTGQGVAELRQLLGDLAAQSVAGESAITANSRQLSALAQAKSELLSAEQAARQFAPLDILSVNLAAAAEALASITGTHTSEAMLDAVFSTFCIGK